MSAAEKEQLRQREERFHSLAPGEQQRILKLHEDLEHAADGAQLRQVMRRYYEWLKTLPSFRRAELLALDPQERLQRIQQLREEQAKIEARRLSPKDTDALVNWMEAYAAEHREEFVKTVHPEGRQQLQQQLDKIDDPSQRARIFMWSWWSWARWQMADPSRKPLLSEADVEKLQSKLSPETQKRLKDLALDEQQRTIAAWIRQETHSHWGSRWGQGKPTPIDDEQLVKFFEKELKDDERDRLLSLPGDEVQKELRRLYQLRYRPLEPPFRLGDGPPGRFRGPRPPEGERPFFRRPGGEPPEAGPGPPGPPPNSKSSPRRAPGGTLPAAESNPPVPPAAAEKSPADVK